MKKITEKMHRYANTFTLLDWALIKFCLIALGVMLACLIPQEYHQIVFFIAVLVFVLSFLPLILRFIKVMNEHE